MMSASTETIRCVQPASAPLLAVTKPTGPTQNGDLAVTNRHACAHLQDFCGDDRRTVTPEVAGSSPVAPVSHPASEQGKVRHIALVLARSALELRSASAPGSYGTRRIGPLRDENGDQTVTRRGCAQELGNQPSQLPAVANQGAVLIIAPRSARPRPTVTGLGIGALDESACRASIDVSDELG